MSDQPNYGFTAGPDPSQQSSSNQQGNGLAVAGLVLGILGLVLFWFAFVGWVVALLGIIFGAIGNSKANKIGGKGKGMAMAGLITGVIGLVAGIGFFVWLIGQADSDLRRMRREMRGDNIHLVQPSVEIQRIG